jgi:hypothetical protein
VTCASPQLSAVTCASPAYATSRKIPSTSLFLFFSRLGKDLAMLLIPSRLWALASSERNGPMAPC